MKIDGVYTFDGPQDVVWGTLQDITVLATVLPGCERLEAVGKDEYQGALKIKVGPVQGSFSGKVKLEDIQAPESYTMKVDGRGAPGFVRATGHLRLEAAGNKTHVQYRGDAQLGGRLASVGQRLMDSSTKAIIKQSMDGLNAAVVARVSAQTEPRGESAAGDPAPVDAPTQTEFAAAVAKEVAKDLAPTVTRYALIAAGILAVLVAVVLALT